MIRTAGEGICEETRFSFLESIRELADGQLCDDEKRDLLKRHIKYYSEQGVILYPDLNGPDQADWLKRVGVDHENLSLALETCVASRSVDSVMHGLTILGCFSQFFKVHGNYNRLRRDIELLLQVPVSPVCCEYRARVLSLAASLAIFQMDLLSARRYYCDMLSITESVNPAMAAGLRLCLGWIAIQTENDLPFARSCYSMALTEYTSIGNRAGVAATYGALAQLDALDGDYPSAIERLRACVEIQRDHNNLSGVTHFLRELAAIYTSAGQMKEALSCLRESLEGYVHLCDARGLAELYVSIANTSPHDDEAIALLGTAAVINAHVSVENPLIEVVISKARLAMGTARLEAARTYGSKLKEEDALSIARRLTACVVELELGS
jgi:non-specific serine/threonine protein kinase